MGNPWQTVAAKTVGFSPKIPMKFIGNIHLFFTRNPSKTACYVCVYSLNMAILSPVPRNFDFY
jgi:hypothetical protein